MKKILMLSLAGVVLSAPAFAEHEAGASHKGGGNWFEKIDTNSDGSISKEEFFAPHEARFVESDADKDGKVTREEAEAQKQKWKAEMDKKREERRKMKEAEKAKGDVKTETEAKTETKAE
ncbi:MAG: EF-hand domain-containing protein [Alphaproteobacteria bacterium]